MGRPVPGIDLPESRPGLAHYYFESKEELLLAALMKGCPLPDLRLEGIPGLDQARLGFASSVRG